ncbi:M20 family metallopeptidase [Micromonospora sp. WMMD1102]|uniref:M20 metallopeptidase family protein n=1 Tax=Micromonospora sp. WMMD1102 TaxID=3016105 RepID=UPI002414E25F|nr:M20 family metallopeptidase [Micromonospora sp. WMMD1102]MDG4788070.1 M20 family metallopeptidase [Micromonospora sp. WMMD1102]
MIDTIALRRRLHQRPELDLHLPETRSLLLESIAPLGLRVETSESCSSLAVVVPGSGPGPTVLLRADMDGLPVVEESGVEFTSQNGNMHACGHDLHMAALVGAVHELHRRRDEYQGDVLAVFQPGEEGAGGAALMIAEKVLLTTGQRPLASYGVHVLSFTEPGIFACRVGAVMGATIIFDLEIQGRGGHAARPYAARDPISTAALIVQGIQTFVTQHSSPADPIVVTVGSLCAGTVANVIPDNAVLKVSLRATSSETARDAYQKIVGIGTAIVEAYGLRIKADVKVDLAPTISAPDATELVRQTVTDLYGAERYRDLVVPEMISEDFSLFLEQTGGAFVLVGAAVEESPHLLPSNHSARARFDDTVVPDIAGLLAELAIRRLRQASTTNGATRW